LTTPDVFSACMRNASGVSSSGNWWLTRVMRPPVRQDLIETLLHDEIADMKAGRLSELTWINAPAANAP